MMIQFVTLDCRLPPHVSNETSLDGMIYTKDMPLYQVLVFILISHIED